jgi:hypothetical protein
LFKVTVQSQFSNTPWRHISLSSINNVANCFMTFWLHLVTRQLWGAFWFLICMIWKLQNPNIFRIAPSNTSLTLQSDTYSQVTPKVRIYEDILQDQSDLTVYFTKPFSILFDQSSMVSRWMSDPRFFTESNSINRNLTLLRPHKDLYRV